MQVKSEKNKIEMEATPGATHNTHTPPIPRLRPLLRELGAPTLTNLFALDTLQAHRHPVPQATPRLVVHDELGQRPVELA